MVIGFKKQFVEPILQGSKVHTIREDKGNRWQPGTAMHMRTGSRFSKKEYRQFALHQCISTQEIKMWIYQDDNGLDVLGVFISSDKPVIDFEQFVQRDGFADVLEFSKWWTAVCKELPNEEFNGKVIHWTNLRY